MAREQFGYCQAQHLQKKVVSATEVAGLPQTLLLLAGDVELNPGPMTAGPLRPRDISLVVSELEGVAEKWFELGLQLGLSASWLEGLKQEGKDPLSSLRDVIREWLKGVDLFPMWYSVRRALESVGEPEIAKEIDVKFCTVVGPFSDEQKRSKLRMERPSKQGCGFESCRCASLVESSLLLEKTVLPYFNPDGSPEGEARRERLIMEHKEMVYTFQCLLSATWRSLSRKSITPARLVDYLESLQGTDVDKAKDHPRVPLFSQILSQLREDLSLEEVFVDCGDYYSYLNHIFICDMLKALGRSIEDKRLYNQYQDKFSYFGKRKVVEAPPFFMAPSRHGHTCVSVKVNRDPTRSTINDIELFRQRLAEMLKMSKYALKLISIVPEDGVMVHLYQFPQFLRSVAFPLTDRQKNQLRSDRILTVKCCDYEFDVEELGPDPVEELMKELAEEERVRVEAEAARRAAARERGEIVSDEEPEEEIEVEPPPPPSDESLMDKMMSSLADTSYSLALNTQQELEVTKTNLELARPGMDGKNYVAVLPQVSDKLIVYGLILGQHIAQKVAASEEAKVVIVARTKPRTEQLHAELKSLLPKASIELFTGAEENSMTTKLCLREAPLIVCTAGKLFSELESEAVHFSTITLLLVDDCHMALKENSVEDVFIYYIRRKIYDKLQGPQMVGVTCSPGEGFVALTTDEMRRRMLNVCAVIDATSGMRAPANFPVRESPDDVMPSVSMKSFMYRNTKRDFTTHLSVGMGLLEDLCEFSCPFEKWSHLYENFVQARLDTLLSLSTVDTLPSLLPTLCHLELLLCYSNALCTCREYDCEDGIQVLRRHHIIADSASRASSSPVRQAELSLVKMQAELQEIMTRKNPILQAVVEDLGNQFSQRSLSKGLLFVDTMREAQFLCEEISKTLFHAHPIIVDSIQVTKASSMEVDGNDKQTTFNVEALDAFSRGECRLLVLPFAIEQDKDQLHLPSCNFLLRLHQRPNKTGMVETEYLLTSIASTATKPCSGLLDDLQGVLMREVLKELPLEEDPEMFSRRQTDLNHDNLGRKHIPMYVSRKRKTPAVEQLTLRCKKCKTFACKGTDVYTLFVDGGQHYVVPGRDFNFRFTTKVYRSKHKAIKRISRRRRMFCNNCDARWGSVCYFPIRGCELPVIKSKHFLFEMEQKFYRVKMWSDALFYVPPLTACTFFRIRGNSPPSDSE